MDDWRCVVYEMKTSRLFIMATNSRPLAQHGSYLNELMIRDIWYKKSPFVIRVI